MEQDERPFLDLCDETASSRPYNVLTGGNLRSQRGLGSQAHRTLSHHGPPVLPHIFARRQGGFDLLDHGLTMLVLFLLVAANMQVSKKCFQQWYCGSWRPSLLPRT